MIEVLYFLTRVIFPLLMLISAFYDLFTMRIPNALVGLVAIVFLGLAFSVGMNITDIGMHILAGLAVLVVTFGFFAAGWIGGGDAKLAAAIALWFGFDLLLPFLLYASVFGGALTLIIIVGRNYMLPARLMQIGWIKKLHNASTGIPYGIALALAALLVYPHAPIFDYFAPASIPSDITFDQLQNF